MDSQVSPGKEQMRGVEDEFVKCEKCIHIRLNRPLDPFAGVRTWTPELLERKSKWDEDQRKQKQLERERFLAKLDFDYEPLSYPWCAKQTEDSDRYVVDPVSGPPRKIYVLCGYANEDGKCKDFTPL